MSVGSRQHVNQLKTEDPVRTIRKIGGFLMACSLMSSRFITQLEYNTELRSVSIRTEDSVILNAKQKHTAT